MLLHLYPPDTLDSSEVNPLAAAWECGFLQWTASYSLRLFNLGTDWAEIRETGLTQGCS